MTVQDLVNQLVMFPPTMEVFTLREDLSFVAERYRAIDAVNMGNALIEQEKDETGSDVSTYKVAIIIKAAK